MIVAIYCIVLLLSSSSHHNGLSVAGFSTVSVRRFPNSRLRQRDIVGQQTMKRSAPSLHQSGQVTLPKFRAATFTLLRDSSVAVEQSTGMETSPNEDPTSQDSLPTIGQSPKRWLLLLQSLWSRTRATLRRVVAMLLSLLCRLGRPWTKPEETLDVSTRDELLLEQQLPAVNLEPIIGSETTVVVRSNGAASTFNSTIIDATTTTSPVLVPLDSPTVPTPGLDSDDCWALAAPTVNLSGHWTLLVTNDFMVQYDAYLQGLGQPLLVRSLAKSLVRQTTEETIHDGRNLTIRTRNARGVWERTLISSGKFDPTTSSSLSSFVPLATPIVTADQECVASEAWWEERGSVHVSWLRGVTKYSGGGNFESRRHVETVSNDSHGNVNENTVYVCRSTFYPSNPARDAAQITWRFVKVQ
jgi:hypothetical protein